jgi:hypothetical protein
MANTLTPEQQSIVAAVQAAQPGDVIVVEARAGAGKTYTAVESARVLDAKGLQGTYMAFNKSTQLEADKKLPKTCRSRTSHSLAWAFGKKYTGRMTKPMGSATRVRYSDAARQLGIKDAEVGNELLGADRVLRIAVAAVGRFARSADNEITASHIWREQGIEDHGTLVKLILPVAHLVWADVQKEFGGVLNVQGEHYIKMWQLTHPRINSQYIIYDEAQDANGAVADVVMRQRHAIIIVIGDSAQAINGWNGAVNSIQNIFKPVAKVVLPLSESFRFQQHIADAGNLFLGLLPGVTPETLVKGRGKLQGEVTDTLANPDAVLCRTNAGCLQQAMEFLGKGKRVHIVGGGKTIQELAEGARCLMAGRRSYHPDLAAFKNWAEVQDYAKDDEGRDLAVFVKMIDQLGTEAIIDAMKRLAYKAEYADVVISTMHKAKGLQWLSVQIHTDVKAPKQNTDGRFTEELSEEMAMLLYVACTRAEQNLGIGGVSWIYEYVAQLGYALAA